MEMVGWGEVSGRAWRHGNMSEWEFTQVSELFPEKVPQI
jgi:hypothetical protein